jgi:hypothetical protein
VTAAPTLLQPDRIAGQGRGVDARKETAIFSAMLVGSFILLSLLGLFQHEMWRDELQAWLISRDSSTVVELLHNLRYEGHPAVWYLILQVITRFTHDPLAMQFCHLLIATGSVYLITAYSPFSRLQKVLIAFGYFPFFEYGMICRSYALGLLFVFAFCAFRSRTQNYLLLFGVLSLLANTSYAGAILAVALGCGLIVDRFIETRDLASFRSRAMIGGIVVFALSLAFSASVMRPPPGQSADKLSPARLVQSAPSNLGRISASLSAPLAGYLPIQSPVGKIWSTATLSDGKGEPNFFFVVIALGLCSFFLYAFREAALPAVAFSLATAALIIWNYVYPGAIRQQGHFFVIWLACLWLAQSRANSQNPRQPWQPPAMPELLEAAIIIILTVNTVFGVASYLTDFSTPFSSSREVSRFLVQNKLDKQPIAVLGDFVGIGVAAYLDRKVYSLIEEKDISFIVHQPRERITKEVILKRLADYVRDHKYEQFVVIAVKKLPVPPKNLALIYRGKPCVASKEESFVYLHRAENPDAQPGR